MAYDLSQDYLARIRLFRYPRVHIRILLAPLIRRLRKIICRFRTMPRRHIKCPAVLITDEFERTKMHFHAHRWAWIPNILSDELFEGLRSHWPPRYYLKPAVSILKSYDIGFKWRPHTPLPQYIEQFPELLLLLEYMSRPMWSARLKEYLETDKEMMLHTFLIHSASAGSCVVPHRDDPLPNNESPYINMLIFVDGAGGGNSGELMLSRDREQRDIFFIPPSLTNCCVLYDALAHFYHGFPSMAPNTYRYAIGVNFKPVHNTRTGGR